MDIYTFYDDYVTYNIGATIDWFKAGVSFKDVDGQISPLLNLGFYTKLKQDDLEYVLVISAKSDITETHIFNLKSEVKLIKGNSTHNDTINNLKKLLKGNKIDVLFIDGDHSYEGVKKDFLNYSDFVSSNGLIILDDFEGNEKGVINFINLLNNNLISRKSHCLIFIDPSFHLL